MASHGDLLLNRRLKWGMIGLALMIPFLAELLASRALAQSQSLLPPAELQFSDPNGVPYAGGKVYTYIPKTTTPKLTWQDPNASVPNTNPIILDSAGRAIIWGSGLYREVLQDQFGSTVWDQLVFGQSPSVLNSVPNGTILGNDSGVTGPVTAISIGTGLTMSGGTLSVNQILASLVYDFTNLAITSANLGQYRVARVGGLTYTLPQGSTLPNNFSFTISNETSSNQTVTPFATDSIVGLAVGASLTIPGGGAYTFVNDAGSPAAWFWTSGVATFDGRAGRVVPTTGDYATAQLTASGTATAPAAGTLGETLSATGTSVAIGTSCCTTVAAVNLTPGHWRCSATASIVNTGQPTTTEGASIEATGAYPGPGSCSGPTGVSIPANNTFSCTPPDLIVRGSGSTSVGLGMFNGATGGGTGTGTLTCQRTD